MRPRDMSFKELRRELYLITKENRHTQTGMFRQDVKKSKTKEDPDRMQDL